MAGRGRCAKLTAAAATVVALSACGDESIESDSQATAAGPDELAWQVQEYEYYAEEGTGPGDLQARRVPLNEKSTEVHAQVRLGCIPGGDDPTGEIGVQGHAVDYTDDRVIITLTGMKSRSNFLCLSYGYETVELDEVLGDRALYDGSFDPPHKVWPKGR